MATHLLLYLKCQKLRAWHLVWRFRTTIPFSWNPFLQSIDYPASLLTLASGIFWFSGSCCYIYYGKRRFVPSFEGCLFWLRSLRGYSWSIPSSCAKLDGMLSLSHRYLFMNTGYIILSIIIPAVILALFFLPFIFYFCGWLLMPFSKLITKIKK